MKIFQRLSSGFTLIELLIVIAVIGVLAGVVLIGIDPVDKINAANDTKIERDIAALANAMESYAVSNNGTYTNSQALLVSGGHLKSQLTAPSGYSVYTIQTYGTGNASASIYSNVKQKRFGSATFWVWCSTSGRATNTASGSTCP